MIQCLIVSFVSVQDYVFDLYQDMRDVLKILDIKAQLDAHHVLNTICISICFEALIQIAISYLFLGVIVLKIYHHRSCKSKLTCVLVKFFNIKGKNQFFEFEFNSIK